MYDCGGAMCTPTQNECIEEDLDLAKESINFLLEFADEEVDMVMV